jgi:hypothetical protein
MQSRNAKSKHRDWISDHAEFFRSSAQNVTFKDFTTPTARLCPQNLATKGLARKIYLNKRLRRGLFHPAASVSLGIPQSEPATTMLLVCTF